MRGVLLLIVLGALAWFGYREWWDAEDREASEASGFVAPPEGLSSLPAVQRAAVADPDPEPEPAAASPEVPAQEPTPVDREPPDEAARDEDESVELAAPYLPSPVGGEPAGFELPKAPEDGRTELARRLVKASIAQDPAPLNEFMNSGEAREVPLAWRNLISAFWLATIGEREQAEGWAGELRGAEGVTSQQLDLLAAAMGAQEARSVPAAAGRRDPLALAMWMVLLDRSVREATFAADWRSAAEGASELLQLELQAPWPSDRGALERWSRYVNEAQDHHRLSPTGDWPSIEHEVQRGESLISIRAALLAENPGLVTCTGLIERANALGQYIRPGQKLRIPTAEPNVLVDLNARIALYRHGQEVVRAWEVGIGKEGQDTPLGAFEIGEKQEEPSWWREDGPPLPYAHPENPLGTRWIGWYRDGAKTSIGFHGTSDPAGVGGRVSRGCIRMRNEHVEELYELLPVNSSVLVQP